LSADVDHVGPGLDHLSGPLASPVHARVAAAIVERVGRHVEDAHDLRTAGEIQDVVAQAQTLGPRARGLEGAEQFIEHGNGLTRGRLARRAQNRAGRYDKQTRFIATCERSARAQRFSHRESRRRRCFEREHRDRRSVTSGFERLGWKIRLEAFGRINARLRAQDSSIHAGSTTLRSLAFTPLRLRSGFLRSCGSNAFGFFAFTPVRRRSGPARCARVERVVNPVVQVLQVGARRHVEVRPA
jgi:hypothetical protein